jgi:chromosome partitioning protein
MPIITFLQTKGGTGKTTSAFVLAEIFSKGAPTTVIDADPNHPFQEWKKDGGEGEEFEIITEEDGGKIPDAIYQASTKSAFVIVDTEGSANETAARAASMSDLVIVTSTGTPLDQKHAAKAIKFTRQAGKHAGREIPIRVLMTRQKAVGQSRTVKSAIATMRKHGIEVFDVELIERDAFAALFGYATTIFNLDKKKVNDPFKAYANARIFANKVLTALRDGEAKNKSQKQAKSKSKEAA